MFEIFLNRLNELTSIVNTIISQSKKIFQLPSSTDGTKYVAVWNEDSTATEKFNLSDALEGFNALNDRIVTFGTITRTLNLFTFSSGYVWIINAVTYTNPSDIEDVEIEDAAADNFRIDIAVLDTNNTVQIVQGFESTTIAQQPPTPPNTLLLAVFSIFENVVSNPTLNQNQRIVKIIDAVVDYPLTQDDATKFLVVKNDIDLVLPLDLTDNTLFVIKNDSGSDCEITFDTDIEFLGNPIIKDGSLCFLKKIELTAGGDEIWSVDQTEKDLIDVLKQKGREIKLIDTSLGDYTLEFEDRYKYLISDGLNDIQIIIPEDTFRSGDEIPIFNTAATLTIDSTLNIIGLRRVIQESCKGNLFFADIDGDPYVGISFENDFADTEYKITTGGQAQVNKFYKFNGTATITDPSSANSMDFYVVFVIEGTATIDSVAYTAGDYIFRAYHTGVWTSYLINGGGGGSDNTKENIISGIVASGTDTYTATYVPTPSSYTDGFKMLVRFTNANTGASTININSLGAKSIVKGVSTALVAGDIAAGTTLLLSYDGTNFVVVGTQMIGVATKTALDLKAAITYVDAGLATKTGIIHRKATASSAVTGVTTEQILESISFPANTVAVDDIIRAFYSFNKSVSTGTTTIRLRVNTSNSLSGSSVIATSGALASGTRGQSFQRHLNVRTGVLEHVDNALTAAYENAGQSSVRGTTTFDPTIDNWFLITCQNNTQSTDSAVCSNYIFEKL